MSHDYSDADATGANPPRLLTTPVVLGIVCFGIGLLTLVGGILLALSWLLTLNPAAIIFGILLALVGLAVAATGLVLLYRGAVNPAQGAGNSGRNP